MKLFCEFRTHEFKMNGPAPTGWVPNDAPSFLIAVGEPMNSSCWATVRSKLLSGATSVTCSVVGLTTVIDLITWRRWPATEVAALSRAQLNATAAASYGVPSENFTPGRSVSVHTVCAEFAVSDRPIFGVTAPVPAPSVNSAS